MKIDSHQHFWIYDADEYQWITNELNVLRRSFMPLLLRSESKAVGIDGTIAVQARQSIKETEWLLDLA